jgi:NAD(P)-dependent dehydrogenase (short-subunit alcohol dehydrogenase family)
MNNDDPLAPFLVDDRLIVVTGASQGIARCLAENFARAGAHVALVSRRPDKLNEVRQAITARGDEAHVVVADISKLADIRSLAGAVRKLAQSNERRIVLVNNAGLGLTKAALEVDELDWETVFESQVKGTFFCSQQIGGLMLERGYGKIINMSSTWWKVWSREPVHLLWSSLFSFNGMSATAGERPLPL